jgi:hypothetical protein
MYSMPKPWREEDGLVNTCHTEGISSLLIADMLLISSHSNCHYNADPYSQEVVINELNHVALKALRATIFYRSQTAEPPFNVQFPWSQVNNLSVKFPSISDFPLASKETFNGGDSLSSLPLMGQPAQKNQIIKSGWQDVIQDSQAWHTGTIQTCVQSRLTVTEPNTRLQTGEIVMKKHRHAEFVTWIIRELTSTLLLKADRYQESLRNTAFYKSMPVHSSVYRTVLKEKETGGLHEK